MKAAPRILRLSITLYLLLLAPLSLLAQDSVFEGITIKSIQIQSKVDITQEFLTRLTGLRPGMPYSTKDIRSSLDLLYRTGLFTDISIVAEIQDGGVVIRYVFTEKTLLASLTIKGNWAFSDRKIQEALAIRIGDEFTENRWKKALSDLMGFYQRQGYFQIQVITDITREEATNRIHLLIRIKEGNRARIRETVFTGDKIFSNLRLWAVIRSRQGEFYKGKLVERDLQALEAWYHSRGYLEATIGPPEVGYAASTNEVILTFPIEAQTQLRLQFQGHHAFHDRVLESQLLFKEERSYDENVFDASADHLKRFYQSRGYPFVQVAWSQQQRPEEDALVAVFTIQEGPLICLRSLTIQQNHSISTRQLLGQLSTQPGYSPFQCRILDPDILEKDIERVKSLYREQGFLNIEVEQVLSYPEGAEALSQATVSVVLTIREGIQTRVDGIAIVGNRAFTTPELIQKTQLRPGMPYSKSQARKDVDELLRFYHQQGFVYTKINLKERFSDDSSRAQLIYTIDEDRVARIGRIFVEGNTFTRDYVIERELKIRPGDPYNEEKIQLSRHRIFQLGYLREIRFHPVIPITAEPREYTKDMILSVRERPPKAVEFGIGYADVELLRGFVELSHRNIAGTGRSLRLRGEASQIERKSTLTYVEPWLFSLPMDARVRALHQKQVRPTYDLATVGGSAGIEKDLTETLKASLLYQIEFNNFTNVEPEAIFSEKDQGRINIATINPSLILDTREDPFNPTSGTLSGLIFRVAAKNLGSEVQLRKATIYSNWFFPVTRWLVLALSARGGIATRFGETKQTAGEELVPLSERFFLGGRSTVRGYRQDDLGIVGETIDEVTGGSIGGNAVLIGNAELRFFLPGGLGFVLFNDRGNVWLSYKDVTVDELKSTVGAGLRYNTPVGPLRLDAGYKLDRETAPVEESRYEVHFTLGHAF